MTIAPDPWPARAELAEQAIRQRHLRRLWGLPGTELALVSWPPARSHRWWLEWHYWWQAHLIDCLVDAYEREPSPTRTRHIARVIRSHRIRNLTGWTNRYFDDMAWLGLAIERADRLTGQQHRHALHVLTHQLLHHWRDREVGDGGEVIRIGGLPWRKRDNFSNTPANGPAAILLARTGHLARAGVMTDWMYEVLRDEATGLMLDGIRPGHVHTEIYSYCQGVVIGAEMELANRTGDTGRVDRIADLIDAVAEHLCDQSVITGGGGGDGGLFNGILARYLGLVATQLIGNGAAARHCRQRAKTLVLASAEQCWEHRAMLSASDGELPLWSADWTRPAQVPHAKDAVGRIIDGATAGSAVPERDLSAQLGGWKLMEAAARVTRIS